jgi:hypothetical protein
MEVHSVAYDVESKSWSVPSLPAADSPRTLGVRPGDVILDVGTRRVTSIEALTKASADEWASTPPRGSMNVGIESAGAKRTMRFYKPAS